MNLAVFDVLDLKVEDKQGFLGFYTLRKRKYWYFGCYMVIAWSIDWMTYGRRYAFKQWVQLWHLVFEIA